MSQSDNETVRRLRWQCRRGLLELDLLFVRFLDQRFAGLSVGEQASFQTLLEQPDQTLLAWFQGQEDAPSHLRLIIQEVIQ